MAKQNKKTGRNGIGDSGTPAFDLRRPAEQTAPVVFASPHSGRAYSDEFLAASRLDALTLRRSEDAFMDEVMATAPDFGAPLIRALFPRAYVDPNRQAYELDPEMFTGPLPDYVVTSSPRIAAGLGTVARVVANGERIYRSPLDFEEVRGRIEALHTPYHAALSDLLVATRARWGGCLLIDCHSMPSTGSPGVKRQQVDRIDIVLGDNHGQSCAPALTDIAEAALTNMGFKVKRNKPYAGGHTTRHYGRPAEGFHALQIEVNRALYMDEARIERSPGFPALVRRMSRFVKAMTEIDAAVLIPETEQIKAAE